VIDLARSKRHQIFLSGQVSIHHWPQARVVRHSSGHHSISRLDVIV